MVVALGPEGVTFPTRRLLSHQDLARGGIELACQIAEQIGKALERLRQLTLWQIPEESDP